MADPASAVRVAWQARARLNPRAWPHLGARVLGRAATNFVEDRGTSLAAAISYYTLFSLFPLTLLVVSIFGIVLRSQEVQDRVLDTLVAQLPVDPAREGGIADALQRMADLGPTLTIVSLVGALWTASALSAAIRSALNVTFEVTRRRPFIRAKLWDYVLLPIIGLPFLGGIIVSAAWRVTQRRVEAAVWFDEGIAWLWDLGAVGIPFAFSFTAFLLLYRLTPNRHVAWRYAAVGALLAAVLFEALKYGFTLYLEHFASYEVIYGPVASVIVLLFWVYLTANIMLFGAEVAAEVPHVLHEEPRHGRPHDEPGEGDWRRAAWSFIRGLVLVGEEEATAPRPPPEEPVEREGREDAARQPDESRAPEGERAGSAAAGGDERAG